MILAFYKAGLQLLINGQEGIHLFPRSQDEIYVKITGSWDDGIDITPSDLENYETRPEPGANYYKPSITMGRQDQLCVINVGWRILGDLRRSDFNFPTRGILESSLIRSPTGTPIVRIKPLRTMVQHPKSDPIFVAGHEPAPRLEAPRPAPLPPLPSVVLPVQTQPKPLQPPAPPKSVITQAPPPVIKQPAPPPVQRPPLERAKSIDDLKQLAVELNKSLETLPGLFISFVDGRLVLEQEIEEFEEF